LVPWPFEDTEEVSVEDTVEELERDFWSHRVGAPVTLGLNYAKPYYTKVDGGVLECRCQHIHPYIDYIDPKTGRRIRRSIKRRNGAKRQRRRRESQRRK
jgi:hypothetical protein